MLPPIVTNGDCDYCHEDHTPVAHLFGPRGVTKACAHCLRLALQAIAEEEKQEEDHEP